MAINLKGRNFLTLKDFTAREIRYLLDLSRNFQNNARCGIKSQSLLGRNVCLIFNKESTRTRCAFEMAAADEGAYVTFLSNSHMGTKESVEDTAEVLGRFYDGIEFRGYEQETIEELAKYSGVPVWNGLTNEYHPTQILADFLTLEEQLSKPLNDTKLVFVGDTRNNMGNSLMIGSAKMGLHFVGLGPKSLWPDPELIAEMRKQAEKTDASINFYDDIETAVKGADAIYTDVWVSMGEEDKIAERIKLLKPYQVNMDMIKKTGKPHVIFMHCLPAIHDTKTEFGQEIYQKYGLSEMEVTDEVFRSKYSVVFEQAENRLHTIKAVMVATIGNI